MCIQIIFTRSTLPKIWSLMQEAETERTGKDYIEDKDWRTEWARVGVVVANVVVVGMVVLEFVIVAKVGVIGLCRVVLRLVVLSVVAIVVS